MVGKKRERRAASLVPVVKDVALKEKLDLSTEFARESEYLSHEVFHQHHSESSMMRYLNKLSMRDVSLTTSMIPLGSCTMKLNSALEMEPVSWPEFANMHPFQPSEQVEGYTELITTLNEALCEITRYAAVSTQPNSGAAGEYAGLLAISRYHKANGNDNRNICIIPVSAHGTNPASAVMAGMKVVTVKSDDAGNIDMDDLREKVKKHSENLAALMVTYPSTYGVFERGVKDVIDLIHENGGQVYMDGANMMSMGLLTWRNWRRCLHQPAKTFAFHMWRWSGRRLYRGRSTLHLICPGTRSCQCRAKAKIRKQPEYAVAAGAVWKRRYLADYMDVYPHARAGRPLRATQVAIDKLYGGPARK